MKKIRLLLSVILVLGGSACSSKIPQTPIESSVAPTIVTTPTEWIRTPTPLEETPRELLIHPYQDVQNRNLSFSEQKFDQDFITSLRFNQFTKWPQDAAALAERVLDAGMNPGLGIRALHSQGITGKGVKVAIIDQNLFLDHPEFAGKIIKYYDLANLDSSFASPHGPAVTSLLVGEQVGTAPGASVYYVTAVASSHDAQSYAEALNWLVDENENLPDGEKIKAVSVSTILTGPENDFTKNHALWQAAYQRANEAGILVIDCSTDVGILAPCTLNLDHPDDITQCTPGWPGIEEYQINPELIHVPVSGRTFAGEKMEGMNYYRYYGVGGISWSAPYLTGVLAMGWQVNPDLPYQTMIALLFNTAYSTENGAKIINPPAFIDAIKETL